MKVACALLAAWAAMTWGASARAQVELRNGEKYAAGSAVKSTPMLIELTLPSGWSGTYRQKGEHSALLLESDTSAGQGLAVLLRNQTAERLGELLSAPQDLGNNLRLALEGAVDSRDGRMRARYLNEDSVGRALAILGPRQNHVVFFFAGARTQEALYDELLDSLAASTRFADEPVPATSANTSDYGADWMRFLAGQVLNLIPDDEGGAGTRVERALHLCADQAFVYFHGSARADRKPADQKDSDARKRISGRWQIGEAHPDAVELTLISKDGSEQRLQISQDGDITYMSNRRWSRAISDVCR